MQISKTCRNTASVTKIPVGDLKKAERLWGLLVREDAHINPPEDFSDIFQQAFWRSE